MTTPNMKHLITGAVLAIAALPAAAHTDLLDEDFNGTWTDSFSTLDLDGKAPVATINSAFMNPENGVSEPWWVAKDNSNSTDRFAISHSYYQQPGTSNDWLVSNAMTIPSEGFTLSFDAQSLPIRTGREHALSDLWIFITEQPVTAAWQPAAADATFHLEEISIGEDRDNCENDWNHFEYSLDAYKGKTIYVSFANLNTDKDILCLDNVLVRRSDPADISFSAPDYILHGQFNVDVEVKGTADKGLDNWTLTFRCGDVTESRSGARLDKGQVENFTFTANVEADRAADFTITLSGDDNPDTQVAGSTYGLTYQTTKRILAEETTGVWCGNCPTAMYVIESITEDEDYKDFVIPVSIHVGNDPMEVEEYEYMFGVGANAPMFRIDRDFSIIGINPDNDLSYDPANDKSATHRILGYLDKPALADISLRASYLKNGNRISGIDVTAEVNPAVTLHGKNHAIGFILTENNVHHPTNNRSWRQSNYLSGDPRAAEIAFGKLPSSISQMRYQDVARQIYGFRGLENSLPDADLPAQQTVTFNTQLGLPDIQVKDEEGEIVIPALDTRNLYLTAFLMDLETATVMNCARVALSDEAEPKFTPDDLLELLPVDEIAADRDGQPEYFNLQGIRVSEPSHGIYIVRRGSKVSKEAIR